MGHVRISQWALVWGWGFCIAACSGNSQSEKPKPEAASPNQLELPRCDRTPDCPAVEGDEVLCIEHICYSSKPRSACAGVGCDGKACITNFLEFCPDCELESTCVSWGMCDAPGIECKLDETTPWSARPSMEAADGGASSQ